MAWEGKNVTVMGLGLLGGGVGTTRYFVEAGANVTVTDLRDRETLAPSLEKLKDLSVRYVLGEHREEDFRNADLIMKNPAIPENSSYLLIARTAGVPIESEASIFLTKTPAFVIGVTGSKGKSTTAALIAEIVKALKIPFLLTGTPGTSLCISLKETERLQNVVAVAEFSSWDLESIQPHRVSPPIAVVTNIFPDHLNRHDTMDKYREAKAVIFSYQHKDDVAVIPESDSYLVERAGRFPGRVQVVTEQNAQTLPRCVVPGEHFRKNAALAMRAVETALSHPRFPFPNAQWDREAALAVILNFQGLPGRLEKIGAHDGRVFVNDTASTNPAAALAALRTLAGPIVLICGGEDKGLLYDEFAQAVSRRVKHVVLFAGTASKKIHDALRMRGFSAITGEMRRMDDAAVAAWGASASGDTILLSPGAASFNLFKNEYDRGEQFIRAFQTFKKPVSSTGAARGQSPRGF